MPSGTPACDRYANPYGPAHLIDTQSMSYVRLNAEEKALIDNLRWTRHVGREQVYRLAERQRRKRPWLA